jgi:hypothetical protein
VGVGVAGAGTAVGVAAGAGVDVVAGTAVALGAGVALPPPQAAPRRTIRDRHAASIAYFAHLVRFETLTFALFRIEHLVSLRWRKYLPWFEGP